MPSLRRPAALVASLLLAAATARAELPPSVYAGLQAAAGEALVVRVVDVEVNDRGPEPGDPGHGRRVDVVARVDVIVVARSATGVKRGDRIVVRYATIVDRTEPIMGPSLLRVLRRGEETPAWLTRAGDDYAPAARGASFRPSDAPATEPTR